MSSGKISAALGCLADKKTKGVLPLNKIIEEKTVHSILKDNLQPKQRRITIYVKYVMVHCHTNPLYLNKKNAKKFKNQP